VKEQHRNSWGFCVSAYLWTKSLAAGAFVVPALASLRREEAGLPPGPALVALAFLALTGFLLVVDLRQPARFLWTLTRPQWRSWITRGAYILGAYGAGLSAQALWALSGRDTAPWAVLLVALLGLATAVYTAFLFGQSKGRDLWQSPLLAPHLVVQALVAGSALLEPSFLTLLLPINGLLVAGEIFGRHPTEDGRRAARMIEEDRRFRTGVLVLGHLLPLVLLWGAEGGKTPARILILLGLFLWEDLFVQAPQRVPNA
jgi:hypothetical protein